MIELTQARVRHRRHRALDRLEDGRFLLGFERSLGVEALIRSRLEAAAGG